MTNEEAQTKAERMAMDFAIIALNGMNFDTSLESVKTEDIPRIAADICEDHNGRLPSLLLAEAENGPLKESVALLTKEGLSLEREREQLRAELALLGETHQAADKLVTERTLEASKLRAELTKLKPNQGDSLIAAIEGNDAGMSHTDLVLTVKMLRNGRARWRKEAEQAQAELATVRAELTPRNGHTFESLQKMWEDTHIELAKVIATNTVLIAVARAAKSLSESRPLGDWKLLDALTLALTALEAQGVRLDGES